MCLWDCLAVLVSAGVLGCGPGTAACCVASGKLLHISGQQSPRIRWGWTRRRPGKLFL